jgi:hypothetical protein
MEAQWRAGPVPRLNDILGVKNEESNQTNAFLFY